MELLSIITKPDILKLQLYLNRRKDHEIKRNIHLPIGNITYCSLLQYVVYLMKENRKQYEEYKLAFFILLKQTDPCVLDSNGNNLMFYAAVLGDEHIIKALIDAKVPIVVNNDGKMAYEYVDNALLDRYSGKFRRPNMLKLNSYISTRKSENMDGSNLDLKVISMDNTISNTFDRNVNIVTTTESNVTNHSEPDNFNHCDVKQVLIGTPLQTDLLNMKPNAYETDIKDAKMEPIMSNNEDNNKDKSLEVALTEDLFDHVPENEQKHKPNIGNTIMSIQDMKHIDNREAEEILHLERLPQEESSNENQNYKNYKENPLAKEIESDSNPDHFNYTVSRLDIKNLPSMRYNGIKPREVHIKKFPGSLFVHVDSLYNFMTTSNNIESVSIKVICNDDRAHYTHFKKEDTNIEFSELLQYRVNKADIILKIYVVIHYSQTALNRFFPDSRYRKVMHTEYKITPDSIENYHNTFTERTLRLHSYKTKNLVKNFKDIFGSKLPRADTLKIFLSYISKPEMPDFIPNTETLIDFLVYRKNSTILWYNGYVNVRGESTVATHLWKRRLIEWRGYNIIIFNEFSYKPVGVFDLTGCKYLAMNSDVLQYCIKMIGKEGVLELQVDSDSKYETVLCAASKCLDPSSR